MKQKSLWLETDEGELTLSWETKLFSNVSVVVWRGMVIKINIRISGLGKNGSLNTFYYIGHEVNHCEWDTPYDKVEEVKHRICNGYQYLTFIMSTKSLTLRESHIASTKALTDILEPSFEIVYFADDERTQRSPAIGDEEDIESNTVVLWDKDDSSIKVRAFAFYQEGALVVNHWAIENHLAQPGCKNGTEQFIVMEEDSISKLFKEFGIRNGERRQLLVKLQDTFGGSDACFVEIREFLDAKDIQYTYLIDSDH